MTARVLAPGTLLSGRYQVAELIGQSDLSHVYAASDARGGSQVALKVFDVSVMARVAALSEYQTQARQASGLGVEGIARAYDFGIDANSGVPFSTAERISWSSLDRRVAAQGPLGVVELSRALAVVARALDAAHAGRVIHRDLKPQNVFISSDNPEWVRITDFGVSAVRRGAPEALGWGGPPGYTPPDAVDASALPTPGVDLFALGVISFFALTRATPFRSLRTPAFDPNAHWSELNQPLGSLSERAKEVGVALDPAFDPWFARALALAPHERFRSAGEMARELALIADSLSARGSGGPRTMPGIAAAIAQPLVFQPEPSPASLGLAATTPLGHNSPFASGQAPARAAAVAAPAPARGPVVSEDEIVPGLPQKGGAKLPLLIGAGVLLFAGLAFGGYAVFSKSASLPAAEPSAAAPPPSAAAPLAPPAAAAPPAQPAEPAPSAPAAEPAPADAPSATATATPPAAVPAPKPVAAAPKPVAASKPKPGATSAPVAAKPATTATKDAASVKATTKTTKKKCSTFLGCK